MSHFEGLIQSDDNDTAIVILSLASFKLREFL